MTGLHYNVAPSRLAELGCTLDQWVALRDIGLQMIREGICTTENTPLRAYSHQRHAALGHRKIGWQITVIEWWDIWQSSGHWHERGVGRGYMMCRKGDLGPYAIGNVFIGPGAENLSAATKKAQFPIGVALATNNRTRPYRAYCNVGGKQRHLGTFPTVDEARAAYLRGLAEDTKLKAGAA